MKKTVLLSVVSVMAIGAFGNIVTEFSPGGRNGAPLGWEKHAFVNYQPYGETEVEGTAPNSVLHVFNVKGISGCGIMPQKRLRVRGGDVVTFTCDLKGKGGLTVFLTHLNEKGENAKVSGTGFQRRLRIPNEWRREKIVLYVKDGVYRTKSAIVIFEFSPGSDARMRNLEVDIARTLRSGNFTYDETGTFYREDFEGGKDGLTGNPEIVSVSHEGGMTVGTRAAEFSVPPGDAPLTVMSRTCPLRGDGKFLRTSFRVFRLDKSAALKLHLKSSAADAVFELPKKAYSLPLPMECVFRCGDEGEWAWDVRSLSDGSRTGVSGRHEMFSGKTDDLRIDLAVHGGKARTTAVLDEFIVGEERAVIKTRDLPKPYTPPATFDPQKAGWKRVFEDEFEGAAGTPYDKSKWFIPDYYGYKDNGRVRLDGKGNLEIVVDYEKGTDRLEAMDLWTSNSWSYGYFEVRVRFTRNRGFWAAFWMYSLSHLCATEDGVEIDCFEDGLIRTSLKEGVERISLMHAFHANYQRTLKSWGKYSSLPGSLDDFHTVGCLRTPLGVTIYLNGKIAGNTTHGYDRKTPTFDPFRENLVSAPLHMILSACVVRTWRGKDNPDVKYPESFLIDYVRAYEMPTNDLPRVSWKPGDDRLVFKDGSTLVLEAEVESKTPIKEMYLFDGGAYIATLKKAPWRFEVPFSTDAYKKTCFMEVGNQGVRPDFKRTFHSFTAFAVDEQGRSSIFSGTPRRVICPEMVDEAIRLEGVQPVPGKVAVGARPWHYADRVQTGTVRVAEIDVAEDGVYTGTFECFSGSDTANSVLVSVDGRHSATVACPGRIDRSWERRDERRSFELRLKKGRQRLEFIVIGHVTFGPVEFTVKNR